MRFNANHQSSVIDLFNQLFTSYRERVCSFLSKSAKRVCNMHWMEEIQMNTQSCCAPWKACHLPVRNGDHPCLGLHHIVHHSSNFRILVLTAVCYEYDDLVAFAFQFLLMKKHKWSTFTLRGPQWIFFKCYSTLFNFNIHYKHWFSSIKTVE